MNPMAHLLPQGVLRVKRFIQDLVQMDQREGERSGCSVHACIIICVWCTLNVAIYSVHVICM